MLFNSNETITYRINPQVAISETGLIFNPDTGESYTINPIGYEILHLLKNHKNLQEIKEFILEKYDTDDHELENDLGGFFLELKQYQLIFEIL